MNLAQLASSDSIGSGIDLDLAFRRHSRVLRRAVAMNVTASEELIEEACQQAWAQLVVHADRVDPVRVLPWLVTTATRAALKQLQRERRWRSLDAAREGGEDVPAPAGAQCHERLEAGETLLAISRLPERQQRVLWLRGLGLGLGEVATHEACTLRTVQRQLLRGRRSVRLAVGA